MIVYLGSRGGPWPVIPSFAHIAFASLKISSFNGVVILNEEDGKEEN